MSPANIGPEQLRAISRCTIAHYDDKAESFWQGTKDHDVRQNRDALLDALEGKGPHDILDVGCGPGRDLMAFTDLGHRPIGLDGAAHFVTMARRHSGCEVWQQDFLSLQLPERRFDGVFANAVLFHVPAQELPRVLRQLWATLRPGGVLFSSNPRGPDVEQWHGARYGTYLRWETWRKLVTAAGFESLHHYYRPPGKPRDEQPWLASVWRKLSR